MIPHDCTTYQKREHFCFFYLLKQSPLAIQVWLKVQDQVKFDTNSEKGHGPVSDDATGQNQSIQKEPKLI